MLVETINIRKEKNVTLVKYLHQQIPQQPNRTKWQPEPRPAVLILPGGSYKYISDREGEPVALAFLNEGYQAFVLNYTVFTSDDIPDFQEPLIDVSLALSHIRLNAEEWNIDIERIAVVGFSAGGNLASLVGVYWNHPMITERLNMPSGFNQPNALILGYPVLDVSSISAERLIQNQHGEEEYNIPDEFSTYKYIGPQTPPSFIWHTGEDSVVSCKTALLWAESCRVRSVPFELHLFQKGPHGLSVNNKNTRYGNIPPLNTDKWFKMAVNWLNELFNF